MRPFSSLAAAITLAVSSFLAAGTASAASYSIDGAHTSVLFKASHFGITPFWGRFNKVSGSFVFDAQNPAASNLSVEIDVASIFTAEKKRDDHLKSPDFFNAKQFPTIKLVSTAVAPGPRPGTYAVTADLTMRGVTKRVSLELTKTGEGKDPMGAERIGFETTFKVNRLDFGVSYMPEELGKDITIVVAIEGIKG